MTKSEPEEITENTLLGPKTKIEYKLVEKLVRNAEERKAALREGYKDQGVSNPFQTGMFFLWVILLFTLPFIQMAGGMLIGMLAFTLLSILFVPFLAL